MCLTLSSRRPLSYRNQFVDLLWESDLAVFMVREILQGKAFLVLNTWRAPVQKRLKQSTLNFANTFRTGCWTKMRPRLAIIHSFIIEIIRWVLKAYFSLKYIKADYSKNIWKEENGYENFVCPLIGYISMQINYWKLHFCWCWSS